ncbi:PKD domain-containing protein [Nocardioides sp. TF02-7]|uniref:PKD domain-containing protein n=1 Tax=Nocardioides sp. TF02-7 TaxID=2917724 RepID=UPI001F06729A|nr:PKD domain-containing protein [Nocardioides sp. TF02-7]UMG94826.1 PKD domain-containing protein [Nocardioides sp. TF02-7]
MVGYSWTFGDGDSGTGKVVQHTYAGTGSFDVTLEVTDHEGLTSTTTRTVQVEDAVPVSLVEKTSAWTWRYQAGAPGTGWNTVGFDDTGWQQSGTAPLGWAPANASGQVTTNIDTFATTPERPQTAYFRRTFQVTDPARLSQVVVTGVADDGAVFYVNGVEIGRQNMRDGAVTPTTYAPSARRLAVAEADPVVLEVPAGLLVAGTNVIAAETHVNYRGTPDLTFYLSLNALRTP